MTSKQDSPVLSICIPTYNNASNLQKVLNHVLELEHRHLEVLVCDDAPKEEDTAEVIEGFQDPRLRYIENERNIGYEKNLFQCLKTAEGQYLMPLADEDKIVQESLNWVLDCIEDTHSEFTSIVAGYGMSEDYDWDESVPDEQSFDPGLDSLSAFVTLVPHPFANHTWRRNYIGGMVLKADAIDLGIAQEYYGSLYIHNVLMLQAMVAGNTILSSRHLSIVDYYQYEGEHRFWSDFEWSDLELRMKLQKYRMKAVDEVLENEECKSLFIDIETRFAAQLAAWATLQKDTSYRRIREIALNEDIRPLHDIWNSASFTRGYYYYLLVLPLPIDYFKRNVQDGVIPRRAFQVWYHFLARIIPDRVDHRIREWYLNTLS